MKRIIVLASVLLIAGVLSGCGSKNKAESENQSTALALPAPAAALPAGDSPLGKKSSLVPQKTCPVMGGAIDKSQYVDYQGKRIYLCCKGCETDVAKDPEKYIKKLAEIGEAVEVIE